MITTKKQKKNNNNNSQFFYLISIGIGPTFNQLEDHLGVKVSQKK
jgi:hypothetical protein